MADASSFVSSFTIGGQKITVKDATARSTAQSANTKATEASSTANQALRLAQKIEQLSRVTVSYEQQSETITITTATHAGG